MLAWPASWVWMTWMRAFHSLTSCTVTLPSGAGDQRGRRIVRSYWSVTVGGLSQVPPRRWKRISPQATVLGGAVGSGSFAIGLVLRLFSIAYWLRPVTSKRSMVACSTAGGSQRPGVPCQRAGGVLVTFEATPIN